jgi:hypothetical protein
MKFKCVYDGCGTRRLTLGKIYDVSYNGDVGTEEEYIILIDNVGDEATYYVHDKDGDKIWFINIEEIRNDKLNKILNKNEDSYLD